MSILDSFKYGNDLAELLIESANPRALRSLPPQDIELVREHLGPLESTQGYVIGRVVGKGQGVWILSSAAVLLTGENRFVPLVRVPLADIEAAECVAGKYGYTLRLHTAQRSYAIYGASSVLALAFHRMLGRKVRAVPVEGADTLAPQEALLAAHWFHDAACRTQPTYPAGQPSLEAAGKVIDEALTVGLLQPGEREATLAHLAATA